MARYFAIGGSVYKRAALKGSNVKWGCLGEPLGKPTYTWAFDYYEDNDLGSQSVAALDTPRLSHFISTSSDGQDEVEIIVSKYVDLDLNDQANSEYGDVLDRFEGDYLDLSVFFTISNGATCMAFLDVEEDLVCQTGYNIFYEEYSCPVRIRIYMCITNDSIDAFYEEFNDNWQNEELVAASSSFVLVLDATYNSNTGVWSVTEDE